MFEIAYTKQSGAGVVEEILAVANLKYERGEMLAVVAGVATKAGATSKGTHIFQAMTTPASLLRKAADNTSTTLGEKVQAIVVKGGDIVLKSSLTGNSAPACNGVAANTNAAADTVVATFAGTTNDYTNGTIYCPELNQQRLITNHVVSAGISTFTVAPPFSRAVTVGDTIRAVPFAKGAVGVKNCATQSQTGIGTAVSDKASGFNNIEDVDLENLIVYSSCPNQF